jgi:hypothetical protein
MLKSRWRGALLLAGVALVAAGAGVWLAFGGRGASTAPSMPTTPLGTAQSNPTGTARPATQPLLLIPVRSGTRTLLKELDWQGHLVASLGASGPAIAAFVRQSPDGSLYIADIANGQSFQRQVRGIDGEKLGLLDPREQYMWGNDNRHICLMQNAAPNPGEASILEVSDQGKPPTRLGVVATGQGNDLHELAACDARDDAVFVADEQYASGAAATLDIREYSMSSFRLLRTIPMTGQPVHVMVSGDGRYLDEETLSSPTQSRIVSSADGRLVAARSDVSIAGFSSDDRFVAVVEHPLSPTAERVAVEATAGGAPLVELPGALELVQGEPNSSAIAVGVLEGSPTHGPGGTIFPTHIVVATDSLTHDLGVFQLGGP